MNNEKQIRGRRECKKFVKEETTGRHHSSDRGGGERRNEPPGFGELPTFDTAEQIGSRGRVSKPKT